MYLVCKGCGWRIKGDCILYQHLPFHNETCIERFKKGKFPRDKYGLLKEADNYYGDWKKERKILRQRRLRFL